MQTIALRLAAPGVRSGLPGSDGRRPRRDGRTELSRPDPGDGPRPVVAIRSGVRTAERILGSL